MVDIKDLLQLFGRWGKFLTHGTVLLAGSRGAWTRVQGFTKWFHFVILDLEDWAQCKAELLLFLPVRAGWALPLCRHFQGTRDTTPRGTHSSACRKPTVWLATIDKSAGTVMMRWSLCAYRVWQPLATCGWEHLECANMAGELKLWLY